jgi:hypothetical protein
MASLLHWSVDLVEKTMKKKSKTSYTHLRDFLKHHSRFDLSKTITTWDELYTEEVFALLRLTFAPKESHWVILQNGMVFDPAHSLAVRLGLWLQSLPPSARVTSFARITDRGK